MGAEEGARTERIRERLANNAAFCRLEELDQRIDFREIREFFADLFDGGGNGEAGVAENPASRMKGADCFIGKTAAAEADMVDIVSMHTISTATIGDEVGCDVLFDEGSAANHGMATDANELVASDEAGDDGPIANMHFAGELRCVGDDDMVSEDTAVGDMAVGHQETVIADDCGFAIIRAAVDGGEFAQHRAIPDFDERLVSLLELQVLGFAADVGAFEDLAVLAEGRVAIDDSMGMDDTSVSQSDIRSDDGIRADFNIFADFCVRIDNSGWMDVAHRRNWGGDDRSDSPGAGTQNGFSVPEAETSGTGKVRLLFGESGRKKLSLP